MAGRPEILFPLFAVLTSLAGIGPKMAENFAALGLDRPKDLLFHLPNAVIRRPLVDTVQQVPPQQFVTVKVKVLAHNPPHKRGLPYRIMVVDAALSFELVFFHVRGDYLKKILPLHQEKLISGKIEHFDGRAQMVHPEYVVDVDAAGQIPNAEAVYPMGAGITPKVMHKAAQASLALMPDAAEWIEPSLLRDKGWPDFKTALGAAHGPQSDADLAPNGPNRERLAYDEFLAHQLTMAILRSHAKQRGGVINNHTGLLQAQAWDVVGYKPTEAQLRCIGDILADLKEPFRMNRLLQGDVGSGKTLVAFIAMLAAVESGGQAALMAPTEVLAQQHFHSLIEWAGQIGVTLAVLTSRNSAADRGKILAQLANGEIDILIGTHALFQKDVEFNDLRLAVIDEQHRFGVAQRMALGQKGQKTDVLVMTATPIPRSLEMAQYGDMDVSILDEKPAGRKPITTAVVSMERLGEVTEKIKQAVAQGRQVYWVCPMVNESEVSDLTAAEDRFKTLRAAIGEGTVGLVHGQMPTAVKDAAMKAFEDGQSQVLVATTVIEVGVNVPNATIMVIERAEYFGLAQLHQLRGRVGRGAQASSCVLLYQPPLSNTGQRRLNIIRGTEDGFAISEEDLKIRGAGDVIGTAQSGLPRFKVGDLEHQTGLMALAQKDARMLLADDPKLETKRGKAVRLLLWLMEKEKNIPLISTG